MVVDKLSRYGVVGVAASLRCRRYDGGWEVGHSSSGTEDIACIHPGVERRFPGTIRRRMIRRRMIV
jgi:hypothetical protein